MATPKDNTFRYANNAQLSNFFTDYVGLVSVKSFGAVGNGVTDDTTSIQAALDDASTQGNKLIYFPHGTYLNSGLTGTSNFTFLGDNSALTGSTYPITDWSQILMGNSSVITDLQTDTTNLRTDLSSALSESTTLRTDLSSALSETTGLRSDLEDLWTAQIFNVRW